MIKLTYAKPGSLDEVTVLGSEAGIHDLWWRLSNATYAYPTHGVDAIRVTNLDGLAIDLRRGLQHVISYGTQLGAVPP